MDRIGDDLPAPVVPPALLDDRTPGDCVMVRSWPLMVSSRVVDLGSMKPRAWDGMLWENSRKASVDKPRREMIVRLLVDELPPSPPLPFPLHDHLTHAIY